MWFRFLALTSGIFIRRRVIHERGIFFDTRWRDRVISTGCAP
jgi:hypothetical protein